jgi:4-diphosphocytidyl-2-C-methyl-D-erythritol kinase
VYVIFRKFVIVSRLLVLESNAYAKVNLHLEVLNKRSDGYHNIFSVMASVDLYDLLKLDSLSVRKGNENPAVDIVVAGGAYSDFAKTIDPKDNLIYKAFTAYFKGTGSTCSAGISLEKNIPPGAGLGGGSSDAAAVMRLLNDSLGMYNAEELLEVSSSVGSDVPYCVNGGFAICEGRGEVIEALRCTLNAFVIIVNNGIHVDTGRAYAIMKRSEIPDCCNTGFDEKKKQIVHAVKHNNFSQIRELLHNDFEIPVFGENPEIRKVKERVEQCDPDFTIMTGSGSTIIAIFKDYCNANNAVCALRDEFRHVTLAKFI